ncbi:Fur family transcriptional regulator [Acetivibrio mesophilus]|uniref:Transcriptional repressor n=1 Tax=Acetivibrio mesophilus TaxID=2487273 RepID=A0A4Q0I7A3_9FIRM|nr:transcriptional repressor [Acetivibrio mesophilus]ODM25624.1 transcriptional repressor [Clostridium sp. Bc-iso-3]RXE60208.1 transcriptional repressor [Acetivibrio mesophilus]HHV29027.1 transcriptional repressor [Clostridium sp.]
MKKTTDDILAKIGCKNTKSRKAVIEVLESAENSLSAEDIFLCIKEQGSSVNLSTVYRTLDLMESKSLVNKIIMGDGKARYELTVDGHRHHLVCTNCHKSVPIDFCPLEKMEKDIGKTNDFDITGHKLEIYGICPECKKE